MNPNDPVIRISELAESVLQLLENADMPADINDRIVKIIEQWEAEQVIPPGKYDNWPPERVFLYCSPEEVSNHISSTGIVSDDYVIWHMVPDAIMTDTDGNKWTFIDDMGLKYTRVPEKGTYFLSCKPGHVGEIFQMVGSVVACMTRSRFIVEKVE